MAAMTAKPITTFTRASHSPERGNFFSHAGKSASRKNGKERPVAKVAIPITGRSFPPVTDAASRVPMNGPTHAKDARANVRPISSAPA